jgi:pimeloyl-ACP methyl ester carboxylesterase
VTRSTILQENAILVTVDLPGFGGSDSFPHYGAIEVLEALTEFIVGIREQYLCSDSGDNGQKEDRGDKVFIVGHDWGCLLGYRLAAEAPCLADRFILTNAPHVSARSKMSFTSNESCRCLWQWPTKTALSHLVPRC